MQRDLLVNFINSTLRVDDFHDYTINGLQVAGTREINTIVVGVTASLELLNYAKSIKADAVLVHHGYFWKNEELAIIGMKRERLKVLLENDINLLAYHLPLDAHPTLSNNIYLAKMLGLENIRATKNPYMLLGDTTPLTFSTLENKLTNLLHRKPTYLGNKLQEINTIAISSGAAQDFIMDAKNFGADAFITGEVSERTYYIAKEEDIHFYAAGHHATEIGGITLLGNLLKEKFALTVHYFATNNPI